MKNLNLFDVVKIAQLPTVKDINGISLIDDEKTFCTYRTDTGAKLGTVGQSYKVMQNSGIYNIMQQACDIAKIDPEGIKFLPLQGGQKVSFQVQLKDIKVSGYDMVNMYYSFLTSHDGSTGTATDLINFRVYCSNTWRQAMKMMKKYKHTVNGNHAAIEQANHILEAIEESMMLQELYTSMHETPFSKSDAKEFCFELLGFDDEAIEKSARKFGKYDRFMEGLGHELKEVGETVWGAYNGITYTTNHLINRKDKQMDYVLLKEGHTLTKKALKILVPEYAN
jgi:hypothetical protein